MATAQKFNPSLPAQFGDRRKKHGLFVISSGVALHERFWSKVDRNGPIVHPDMGQCWKWTAQHDIAGYAKFGIGRSTRKNWGAHRVAFALTHGFVSQLHVLHKCDNRGCVNPEHLFEGTHADNMRDKTEKGRVPHGVHHYMAKLDANQVRDIRILLTNGQALASIGKQFGVDADTIRNIKDGKTWKRV